MDNSFFVYQNALTEFIREYANIFSISNLREWDDYISLFEFKTGKKFMYFRSPWRFENKILDILKDKIVYYTQVIVGEQPTIIGLIQLNDTMHLRTFLIWDEQEHKFFTGFEFVCINMNQIIEFIDEHKLLILNKEFRTHMGLHHGPIPRG